MVVLQRIEVQPQTTLCVYHWISQDTFCSAEPDDQYEFTLPSLESSWQERQ